MIYPWRGHHLEIRPKRKGRPKGRIGHFWGFWILDFKLTLAYIATNWGWTSNHLGETLNTYATTMFLSETWPQEQLNLIIKNNGCFYSSATIGVFSHKTNNFVFLFKPLPYGLLKLPQTILFTKIVFNFRIYPVVH